MHRGLNIDRLVWATRRKMNTLKADAGMENSNLLWNSMSNGQYFLSVEGKSIPHEQYLKALAMDLHKKNKVSLSEVYDPTRFLFFLDIDWKLELPPHNSRYATKLFAEQKNRPAEFHFTEGFIEDICIQTMRCLNLVYTNTQNVRAIITTTVGEEGFKPYKEMRRVCPFCNNQLGRLRRSQTCSKCNARWEMVGETCRYITGTTNMELPIRPTAEVVPYMRAFLSYGFHIRTNLQTDVTSAKVLALQVRMFLAKWASLSHTKLKYDIPIGFWDKVIDFSPYGAGKGLRVVHTLKTKRCTECNGKSHRASGWEAGGSAQPCSFCGGRKVFINKAYAILGICTNKPADQAEGHPQADGDGKRQSSQPSSQPMSQPMSQPLSQPMSQSMSIEVEEDVDFSFLDDIDGEGDEKGDEEDDAGDGGEFQRYADINAKRAEEKRKANLKKRKFAYARMRSMEPELVNLCKPDCSIEEQQLVFPETAKEYYTILRETSVRAELMQKTNRVVVPVADTSYPLPIDPICRIENLSKTNKHLLERLHKIFGTTHESPECRQDDINTARLFLNKHTKSVQQVPQNLWNLILAEVQDFHECYQQVEFSKPPQFLDANQTTILVTVSGPGCTYCCNIKDQHQSNRAYFILSAEHGIVQKCHNNTTCEGWKGKRRTLDLQCAIALFGECSEEYGGSSKFKNVNYMRNKYPWTHGHLSEKQINANLKRVHRDVRLRNLLSQYMNHLPEITIHTVDSQLQLEEEVICCFIKDHGKTKKIRARARRDYEKMKKAAQEELARKAQMSIE